MNSIRIFSILFIFSFTFGISYSSNDLKHSKPGVEKTFIQYGQVPDIAYQEAMRASSTWKKFARTHVEWQVSYNKQNQKPHRAYGNGIPTHGESIQNRAINFVQDELLEFGVPVTDLYLMGEASSSKHHFVNYYQKYNSLKVLGSRLSIKMTKDFKVILFGLDVYDDIFISTIPEISIEAAITAAEIGVSEPIFDVEVNPELYILPVPNGKKNDYKLVYEVNVKTKDKEGIPANYRTLVDANTSEVLYRSNLVKHNAPAMTVDVDMQATVYTTHSYNPSSVENLPNLKVRINGTNYYTDTNGQLTTSINSGTSGQFYMEGLWSTVRNNGNTPTFTTSLSNGTNTISFDSDALIQERSAYYHVNTVHDYLKSKIPTFTGMDFSLTTNVDDNSGTCNAFYNGSSINFYEDGGGCLTYANVADVVYHEYGHGINDNFYQSQGANFQNGAMGEGYADVWGFAITENPILGVGGSDSDPNDYIRRYDIDPKIYPKDIVGEVHADGEIIAGAWWDLYVNIGNDMDETMSLFADAYYGLQATTFNGNEGQAFRDVLLDVLQADDDDGNISNGTPRSTEICNAFGVHGITLISNATLSHSELVAATPNDPIAIQATLTISTTTYLGDVKLFYRINNDPNWTSVVMTNQGGNSYSADIPAQLGGTVVAYYMGVEDNVCGYLSAVQPIGCADPDPNMPYFILVGYDFQMTEDFDNNHFSGSWTHGLPGDDASTGIWEENGPIGSFGDPNILSTCVAPYEQHTIGGFSCALTEVSSSPSAAIGERDVDDGLTTLETPSLDLSAMLNPVVTYHRWYINDPPSGANPGNDWWVVKISADGTNWIPVEATKISDKSWRRFAFRVGDYVTPSSNMKIRFHASDSLFPGSGLTFDGGSLVEAALDDIQIWEQTAQPVQFVSSEPTCNGDCDGQATVTPDGGQAPFTYSWNDPGSQTTPTATGLCASTYTVNVEDALGNVVTGSVVLTEPNVLSGTATGLYPSSPTATDGSAGISVSGGTPPYTYLWNDPSAQTTASISGLGWGSYSVLITDANGCTFTSNTVNLVLGMNEVLIAGSIKIFPNPSESDVNVMYSLAVSGNVVIEITDYQGRLVYQENKGNIQPGSHRFKLNTDEFSVGIYTINIKVEGFSHASRLQLIK